MKVKYRYFFWRVCGAEEIYAAKKKFLHEHQWLIFFYLRYVYAAREI